MIFKRRTLILFACICFEQSAVCQIASGLTAYWPLDGSLADQAGDISGSANLLADDMVFKRKGASFDSGFLGSGGYVSNGNGYAEAPNSIDVRGGDATISVSVWVKNTPRGNGEFAWWETILSKGEGTNFRLHRFSNTGSIAWAAGGKIDITKKALTITPGKWYHIAAIGTPKKLALYIDGVLAVSQSGGFSLPKSNTPLQLGNNPEVAVGGRIWKGHIDDLAIWNRELSLDEVRQIYEAGLSGKALADLSKPQKTIEDDGDGLAMDWEIQYGFEYEGISGAYGDDGADGDPDADELINIKEQELGTNPTLADTDGDGLSDGEEIKTYKTSPLKADTDGDGFDDRREKVLGSDPNNSKSTPVSN